MQSGTWTCGVEGTWTCGVEGTWTCGVEGTWTCGVEGTWTCGVEGTWTCGVEGTWTCGVEGTWTCGVEGTWTCGVEGTWTCGVEGPWNAYRLLQPLVDLSQRAGSFPGLVFQTHRIHHVYVAPKYKTHPNFNLDFLVLGKKRNLTPVYKNAPLVFGTTRCGACTGAHGTLTKEVSNVCRTNPCLFQALE